MPPASQRRSETGEIDLAGSRHEKLTLSTRPAPAVIAGAFLLFALAGYVFGKWYMRLGWDLGWRTSQFFFSYQELGFVKRALVGSALHPFPGLLRNEVFFALSWVFILAFVGLFARWFAHATSGLETRTRWLLLGLCASSPALFLRQGFDLGRFDVLGLIAAVLGLHAIGRDRPLVAGVASAIALLAHEAYLLINLPLLLAFQITRGGPPTLPFRSALLQLLVPAAVVAAALFLFGGYEPGLPALRGHFAADPHYLAAKGAVDEDAIAVLTRGLRENVDFVARMFWEKKAWLHLPLIFAWGALMMRFVLAFYRANALRRDLLFHAALTPLLLSAIASDYYRWVALTATNLFFVVLLQLERLRDDGHAAVVPAGPATSALIATMLLGPISNTKSFPLLFIVLERIFPGLSW